MLENFDISLRKTYVGTDRMNLQVRSRAMQIIWMSQNDPLNYFQIKQNRRCISAPP